MSEVTYRSQVRLIRRDGPDATVELPGGERVRFGVHGPIAEHDGVPPEGRDPASATIDYLVAAAVGSLSGTFGGALEARGIDAGAGRLRALAVGDVETEARVLVLKRIHVTYTLELDPDDDRDMVQRVLAVHAEACPVYRSIHPQVNVTTELDLG